MFYFYLSFKQITRTKYSPSQIVWPLILYTAESNSALMVRLGRIVVTLNESAQLASRSDSLTARLLEGLLNISCSIQSCHKESITKEMFVLN